MGSSAEIYGIWQITIEHHEGTPILGPEFPNRRFVQRESVAREWESDAGYSKLASVPLSPIYRGGVRIVLQLWVNVRKLLRTCAP